VAVGTALRPGNETTFASSTQTNQRQIRRSGAFDGVIDFDAAARDPNRPVHGSGANFLSVCFCLARRLCGF
jgi:hypothetical protein